MASSSDNLSMALFCDFENVALGVRDARYDKFDIKKILERLLLKGSIVVKKAYCDWERYKGFKATMHEANFELIEIPHVRQSGKNSADIRLVVDALDLCYTKSHVNTFVIISGDSDFSPLVSKLRENAKKVIGVGVKQSTSDLLIANCDEFIFYDDLVRESQRALARRQPADAPAAPRRTPEEERQRKETLEKRRAQALEIAAETFEALMSERGDSGKIWASVLKEAIKRRKPDFSESYYGFKTFGTLLEEAQARGLLEFGRDEKSGAYVFRSSQVTVAEVAAESMPERSAGSYFRQEPPRSEPAATAPEAEALPAPEPGEPPRRRRRKAEPAAGRVELPPASAGGEAMVAGGPEPQAEGSTADDTELSAQAGGASGQAPLSYFSRGTAQAVAMVEPEAEAEAEAASPSQEPARRPRRARKTVTKADAAALPPARELMPDATVPVPAEAAAPAPVPAEGGEHDEAPARKRAARPRRTRKPAADGTGGGAD
ncbi:MAG: hypothetical protein RJA36_1789 [Pseudomonadota bacterium]